MPPWSASVIPPMTDRTGRPKSILLAQLITDAGAAGTSRAARKGNPQHFILDELRRVILSGGAPPGTPIPIGEIATLFGVSAIPVRESLKTLVGESLVAHRPNAGYIVA